MLWVQWVVRLLTQTNGLDTVGGQITHTEMVWVQWVVRLLTYRNALVTVGGQIAHTQKWFGYTHRGGQSNGPITHTKKLGILTELGIMDGQITRISWSGYNLSLIHI